MIQGVGIDIEKIHKFSTYTNSRHRDLKRIFTPNELRYCFSKTNPASHLAARFAGKEAVIKALNSLFHQPIDFSTIEIYLDRDNTPQTKFNLKALSQFHVLLSLSHSEDIAIALAIIN